jgi:hypothetical protein
MSAWGTYTLYCDLECITVLYAHNFRISIVKVATRNGSRRDQFGNSY